VASPTTALTPAQRLAKRRKKATSKPAQTTASGGPGGRTTTGARRGPRGNAGDSVTMSRRTSPDPRALSAYARRQGQSQKPKSMDPRAMSGMARGYGQGNVSGQMLKNAGVAQARNQYGAGAGPGGAVRRGAELGLTERTCPAPPPFRRADLRTPEPVME